MQLRTTAALYKLRVFQKKSSYKLNEQRLNYYWSKIVV